MRRSAEIEATISELVKHGAVYLGTEQNKHIRVRFRYQGQERFVIVSATSSDSRRGAANCRKSVRRELGIVGKRTVGERRIAKARVDDAAALPPDKLTAGRDPWAAIRGTPLAQAAASRAADLAWLRLFGACLIAAGHEPVNPAIRDAITA